MFGLQVLLSATLGLRISEVLGLKWSNISLKDKTLTVKNIITKNKNGKLIVQPYPKNRKITTLLIPDILYKELKYYKDVWERKYKNEKRLLFVDKNLDIVSTSNLSMKFKRYCRKKGVEATFHDLRHSFATYLYEQNVNLDAISRQLNHSSVNITEKKYLHSDDKGRALVKETINCIFKNN